jgi:prepilin-type N-terminal cleavage/methylation domain-containing protein
MNAHPKGFTLLELLVVIGILAILASVAVLVLNPAELLRQARDSQRLNDLAAINSALAIYVSTASTISLGTSGTRYTHNGLGTASSVFSGTGCAGTGTVASSTSRAVDNTGWIPVNFTSIPGGSPLSVLPVDPVTGTTNSIGTSGGYQLLYWYTPDTTNNTWELSAKMESQRYSNGGSNDMESTDGGTCSRVYEVGTALNL